MADFTFKILNSRGFEMALKKMQPKKAEKIIDSALMSASKLVEKSVKEVTPESDKGSRGWRLDSRNHPSGTLRDSVKARLRKKVNVGLHAFLAGVSYEESFKQYYAKFLINKHEPNATDSTQGINYMKRGVVLARAAFYSKLEERLLIKIAKAMQTQLNKI